MQNTESADILIWYHNFFMALKTFDKLEMYADYMPLNTICLIQKKNSKADPKT